MSIKRLQIVVRLLIDEKNAEILNKIIDGTMKNV